MPIMFQDTGCEKCRNYWTHPFMEDRDEIMCLLETNMEQQARLYKCNYCLAYWEEPNGAYPCGLTNEELEKLYGIKNFNEQLHQKTQQLKFINTKKPWFKFW